MIDGHRIEGMKTAKKHALKWSGGFFLVLAIFSLLSCKSEPGEQKVRGLLLDAYGASLQDPKALDELHAMGYHSVEAAIELLGDEAVSAEANTYLVTCLSYWNTWIPDEARDAADGKPVDRAALQEAWRQWHGPRAKSLRDPIFTCRPGMHPDNFFVVESSRPITGGQ